MSLDKVIAKVGDREITERAFFQFIQGLSPELAMQLDGETGRKNIIEELINQEVIYLDALESNLAEDEGFLEELERFKEGLLKQYAVHKLISDVQVTDEEAKEYYEENKEIFKIGENATASHILVEEKEKAEELIEEIKNGLDFAEAAKENSICQTKNNGGSLGQFGRGRMVPEFEKVAFELEAGEMTEEPVKSQFGYHIIKVHERSEGGVQDFEDVVVRLKDQLLGMKQQTAYLERTGKLKEKYEVEYIQD